MLTFALTTGGCSAQNVRKNIRRDIQAADVVACLERGEHIYYDSCTIWGELDFTALRNRNRIASHLTQVYVEPSVTFVGCVFTDRVKASDAAAGLSAVFGRNLSFTGCDFRSDVDFAEIDVSGNVFFTGAVFRGKVNMQGAYFRHRKAYFNEAKFEEDALFQNAVFTGDANFMHTTFGASAMFQKARIGGLAMFGAAQFDGYADFTYVHAAEAIFNHARFNTRRDFSYSNILNELRIENGVPCGKP
jgi:uncharacterized protein YjbI with pentapeptide repeats